jgi:DNA-binding LytR/AlgR family response regulator
MVNIAICDDELIYLEQLEQTILQTAEKLDVPVTITRYTNGFELLKYQTYHQLFFLDIEMPEVTGFYLANQLMKNEQAKVVMVSNYQNKVFEAFKYNVFRFIPKPTSLEAIEEVLTSYEADLKKSFVLVYSPFHQVKIRMKYEDIEYIEAFAKKVSIIGSSKEELYEHKQNMQWWLTEFAPFSDFYQVHRSFIVNFAKVQKIDANFCYMNNGQKVPIAQRKRKAVQEQFEAHILKKMSE